MKDEEKATFAPSEHDFSVTAAQYKYPTIVFSPVRWTCETHGETMSVMHVDIDGRPRRTYCAECMIDRLNLPDISETEHRVNK